MGLFDGSLEGFLEGCEVGLDVTGALEGREVGLDVTGALEGREVGLDVTGSGSSSHPWILQQVSSVLAK